MKCVYVCIWSYIKLYGVVYIGDSVDDRFIIINSDYDKS